MNALLHLNCFSEEQLRVINQAAAMAEELVSDFYKMSASQWLHPKYDIKTLADLEAREIVDGPFAQIIRYEGKRKGSSLGSETYDYYKICLQDHAVLNTLEHRSDLDLLAFSLYILTHELIHIVRFSKFLQNFNASEDEKLEEERRVHEITHQILAPVRTTGIPDVLEYYRKWLLSLEEIGQMKNRS